MRLPPLLILALALTACGSTVETTFTTVGQPSPILAASTGPTGLTSVNCPFGGGPTGGSLSGLGATLGAFTSAHGPQDSKYPSQFGGTISGGDNDGCRSETRKSAANDKEWTTTVFKELH